MDELLAQDPYITLGVSKDADSSTIKAAYRKLAIKHHPDKCAAEDKDEATQKFHIIQEAYDHIGTDENRKKYNELVHLFDLRDRMKNLRTSTGPTSRSGPTRSQTYTASSSTSRVSQSMADVVLEAIRKSREAKSYKAESGSRKSDDRLRDHLPRSRTFDQADGHRMYDDAREKVRRQTDDYRSTEQKYSIMDEEARRRISGQSRPSPSSRRTSYRDSPRYDDEVRRSRAAPSRQHVEEDDFDEKEKERAQARLFKDILDRKRREREALEQREREREREYAYERDGKRDYERVRERPREERRGRERSRKDEEPRPPPLKASYSEVPEQHYAPPPSFSRSKTMPMTEANAGIKREKRGSQLKHSVTMDSGYSSASPTHVDDQYGSKKTRPAPKKHTYSYTVSPDRITEDERERMTPSSHERVSPKYPLLSSPRGSFENYSPRRREQADGGYFSRSNERLSGEKLFREVTHDAHPPYPARYPNERAQRHRDDAHYPSSPRFQRQYSTPVAS